MNTTSNKTGGELSASPKIMKCSCEHKAQDELHGHGMRVHNPCKKQGGGTGYRCTVCGRIHD